MSKKHITFISMIMAVLVVALLVVAFAPGGADGVEVARQFNPELEDCWRVKQIIMCRIF